MADLFQLQNLSYRYIPTRVALQDITLSVRENEIVSVIGSNGSGKTTLLHILSGLLFASDGSITYREQAITRSSFKDPSFNHRFRSSIGYVFQNSDAQLFCPTVFDELVFGPLQLGYSIEEAGSRAESIMELLHIAALRDLPPYMLSGGEKKRVSIGAVLTSNPEVLVIDEPMGGLDPKTRAFLIELIFNLNEAGKTVIIATHHLELVNHLQSRVIVMNEMHRVEKCGSANEILQDTELLVRTNLVGEYPHKHDGVIHKHLSADFMHFMHRHK